MTWTKIWCPIYGPCRWHSYSKYKLYIKSVCWWSYWVININEKVISSKKTYLIQDQSAKPYPICDENGQIGYPIYDQNGWKKIILWGHIHLYNPYKGVPPPLSGCRIHKHTTGMYQQTFQFPCLCILYTWVNLSKEAHRIFMKTLQWKHLPCISLIIYNQPAIYYMWKVNITNTTRTWGNICATFLLPLPQLLQNLQLFTLLPQLLQNIFATIFQINEPGSESNRTKWRQSGRPSKHWG